MTRPSTRRSPLWALVCKAFGGCAWCAVPLSSRKLTRDLIVPAARANTLPACAPCNAHRGDMSAGAYAAYRGLGVLSERWTAAMIKLRMHHNARRARGAGALGPRDLDQYEAILRAVLDEGAALVEKAG